VGPRTGLDDMEKRKFLPLLGLELRPLGRPVRSQSLYRLPYPGSHSKEFSFKFTISVNKHENIKPKPSLLNVPDKHSCDHVTRLLDEAQAQTQGRSCGICCGQIATAAEIF
jgi:hypothetical protein